MSEIVVRAVAVCVTCEKREEFDATLDATLDTESDSYGSTSTRVVLSTRPEAPAGWRQDDRSYRREHRWCSDACMKRDPYGRGGG